MAARRGFEVIVNQCTPDGNCSFGADSRWSFPSLPEAHQWAIGFKLDRNVVIIRPNFNEGKGKDRYYREWRSFNGNGWEECRWNLPELLGEDHANTLDYAYNVAPDPII